MNQYPRLGPLLRLILIAVLVGPLLIGPLVAIYSELLGILVVELSVGLTVAAVMITIFFAFAGREQM